MLVLSNLLALALLAADEPPAPRSPEAPKPTGSPGKIVEDGSISIGAQEIPLGGSEQAVPKVARPQTSAPESREAWTLSLRDAIRIGLDNSEAIRVIRIRAQSIPVSDEGPTTPDNVTIRFAVPADPNGDLVIAPVNRDASAWNFQAAVMAHVRSIEQQYWALWEQQVTLGAREAAVKLAEEALRRERDEMEVGHGVAADIAEAEEQLEKFKLGLVSAVSDRITTERQLRNLLGLPPADKHRIVAASAPVEAQISPDWEASLRAMNASQPELVQQQILVRLAELRLLLARNQLLPLLGLNALYQFKSLGGLVDRSGTDLAAILQRGAARQYPAGLDPAPEEDADFTRRQAGLVMPMPIALGRAPLANTRQAQYQLLRERDLLRQTIHQTTHTLARSFLEVDSNHKQFRAARRLREAAEQRLGAQRAFYEEGRITIDRLLGAAGQHANAVAQEAQYLAGYNTSIAALEEAKGTLLAFDEIAIAEPPSRRKAYIQAKRGEGVEPAAFEAPAGAPAPVPVPDPIRPVGKTFRLKARISPGELDLDIEVRDGPAATGPLPR